MQHLDLDVGFQLNSLHSCRMAARYEVTATDPSRDSNAWSSVVALMELCGSAGKKISQLSGFSRLVWCISREHEKGFDRPSGTTDTTLSPRAFGLDVADTLDGRMIDSASI